MIVMSEQNPKIEAAEQQVAAVQTRNLKMLKHQ